MINTIPPSTNWLIFGERIGIANNWSRGADERLFFQSFIRLSHCSQFSLLTLFSWFFWVYTAFCASTTSCAAVETRGEKCNRCRSLVSSSSRPHSRISFFLLLYSHQNAPPFRRDKVKNSIFYPCAFGFHTRSGSSLPPGFLPHLAYKSFHFVQHET